MTAVFVVGAIAVAGALVARLTWRRPVDERHSIETHQQTLDTLRSMADRRPSGRPEPGPSGASKGTKTPAAGINGPVPPPVSRTRPVESRTRPIEPGRATTAARTKSVRPGSARSGRGAASVSKPTTNGHPDLVFVDEASPSTPGGPSFPSSSASVLAGSRGRAGSGRSHHGRRSGRRGATTRLLPVLAAGAVLALVVGSVVAFVPSRATPHRPPLAGPRTKVRHAVHPTTTATTVPELQPTSATTTAATYGAPSSAYTVALQATGLCWVQATSTATGQVVWTGTLASGQTRSIPSSGSMILRLGAADDVIVTMNGEQVALPAGFHSPFNLSFVVS